MNELFNAIQALPTHKTLGKDGIPTEFFQLMWPVVGEHVLAFVEEVFS